MITHDDIDAFTGAPATAYITRRRVQECSSAELLAVLLDRNAVRIPIVELKEDRMMVAARAREGATVVEKNGEGEE